MAVLDFPSSPTAGDLYVSDVGITYKYNGYAWEVDVLSMTTGPQGPQGEPGTPADMSRVEALEARCTTLEAQVADLYAQLATKATLNADVRFNTVVAAGNISAFG
jgi:hypothetical protein